MMLTRAEVEALANESDFNMRSPTIKALARDWLALEAVVARLLDAGSTLHDELFGGQIGQSESQKAWAEAAAAARGEGGK